MNDICNKPAGIPYLRCGRTKPPYKRMHTDFGGSWKEGLIMNINRRALFAVSVHRAEGDNIVSAWAPRSLTNLDTWMGVPHPSYPFQGCWQAYLAKVGILHETIVFFSRQLKTLFLRLRCAVYFSPNGQDVSIVAKRDVSYARYPHDAMA